jgi:hypothetical protein
VDGTDSGYVPWWAEPSCSANTVLVTVMKLKMQNKNNIDNNFEYVI